jgi:hypothetical protein
LALVAHVLNNILRRHFAELTEKFLDPLDGYFSTLLSTAPSCTSLHSLLDPPDVHIFLADNFLRYLASHPPALPVSLNKPIAGLYQAFLCTPNFDRWLRNKYRALYLDWRYQYLSALCSFNVDEVKGGEVEVIEILLRLREELEKRREEYAESLEGSPFLGARGRGFRRLVVSEEEMQSFEEIVEITEGQYRTLWEQAGKVIEKLPEGLREGVGWYKRLKPRVR